MTKNLTEKWKNGELEEGNYYIKDKYGNFIIAQYLPDYDYDHQDGYCLDGYRWCALGFDYDDLEQDSVVEVLAEIPDYIEWKNYVNGYNEEHKYNLKLIEENQKLKELLKECREVAEFTKTIVNKHKWFNEVITKIDKVLK